MIEENTESQIESAQADKEPSTSQDAEVQEEKKLKIDPVWLREVIGLEEGEKLHQIHIFNQIEGANNKLGFNIFSIETVDMRLKVVTHSFKENTNGERVEEEIRQRGSIPLSELDSLVDGMAKRLDLEKATYELIDLTEYDSLEEQLDYLGTLVVESEPEEFAVEREAESVER